MPKHIAVLGLAGFASWMLACASNDVAGLATCPSLDSLPALPASECRDGDELRDHQAWIEDRIVPHAGPLLVRIEFDAGSKVRAVCADRNRNAGSWLARRELGARHREILAAPAGPACLADRRLDLNRREAKWAEIKRVEDVCRERARISLDTLTRPGIRLHGLDRLDPRECIEYESDWVLLDRPGSNKAVIFAKPEVADPPRVRSYETVSRCSRETREWDFESQVACIEADGWEPLH